MSEKWGTTNETLAEKIERNCRGALLGLCLTSVLVGFDHPKTVGDQQPADNDAFQHNGLFLYIRRIFNI